MDIVSTIITWAIPLMIAIIFHEYGHVFLVRLLSAPGSTDSRLSFNPVSFVDLFGTIVLPLMLVLTRSPFIFGWARTLYRGDALANPKRDHVLIAIAGPLANLLLAFIAAIILRFVGDGGVAAQMLGALIIVNIFLAVLNILPLPGFDGFTVVTGLLPHPLDAQLVSLNKYALPIMLLIFIGIPMLIPQFNIFSIILDPLMDPLKELYFGLAGRELRP